jgi:hypothetical protein
LTHSQVPGWTHLKGFNYVELRKVGTWKGAPDFQHYRGVEGHARSPGIRLGRGTRGSSLNLHPKTHHTGVSSHSGHPWVLGQATSTLNHKTHHGPNSGEATTFPHIVFSAPRFGDYIQMALFPGTPKLESRNYPGWSLETLGAHNSWLQSLIATVATLLWPSVGVKPNTWKSWDLESSRTPECLELDNKTQNTWNWGVLGVIGKVLKRRYRKCPRIGNSDICNPSYGQKKGRESNCQFDSRPLKVGNRPLSDVRFEFATWR